MINDQTSFAPFVLFEYSHDPGRYCLVLTDRYMFHVAGIFEEYGANGNGYGWARVARRAVYVYAPRIAEKVEFAPEAGMLAVRGDDLEALRQLGTLLRNVFHDRSLLVELIRGADLD